MRVKRKKCKYSVYHLIVRGNNRQAIFLDNADKEIYLLRLKRYAMRYNCHIYAYCLMTNHIHLLVYDNGSDISKFMQGLNLSYTIYFNRTYGRCGHLFQDRFKSIIIKSNSHFLQVAKYIHLNPVKARMVSSPHLYAWSSYNFYLGDEDPYHIVNTCVLLGYFSRSKRLRHQGFLDYMDQDCDEFIKLADTINYCNIDHRKQSNTLDIQKLLVALCSYYNVAKYQLTSRYNRSLKDIRSLSIYVLSYGSESTYRELAHLFHICPSSIGRCIHHAMTLALENPDLLVSLEPLVA